MMNSVRRRPSLGHYVFRRWTADSIWRSLLFQKEHHSWWVVLGRFSILGKFIDKHWHNCLWAIGKSENQLTNWVPTDHTITQIHHCDALCVPTVMKTMLATIDAPSALLKYTLKCTSPRGSSVLLALTQCTHVEWGVHYLVEFGPVEFCWQVLFPTTFFSADTLQSVLSGAPHSVDHLCHLLR